MLSESDVSSRKYMLFVGREVESREVGHNKLAYVLAEEQRTKAEQRIRRWQPLRLSWAQG